MQSMHTALTSTVQEFVAATGIYESPINWEELRTNYNIEAYRKCRYGTALLFSDDV